MEQGQLSVRMNHAVVQRGVSLFSGGGCSPQGYSIAPTGDMPSQNMVIGCLLGGSGAIHAEGNQSEHWRVPGQLYAVSLSERKLTYDIDAHADYQSLAVMLTPDALELMGSEDGLPAVMDRVLNGRADPMLLMRTMSPAALRIAHDLMSPAYRGAMRHLYQQAKTLELLAYQMDSLAEEPVGPGELGARDMLRVREAHERIMSNLQDPPDMESLARMVGLSPKRLNRGFKQVYGATVFNYLMEARLLAARKMLEEGLDIPLKQLAWAVGYNQLSNFSTAFSRRFGVPPSVYRRHAEED